MQEEYQSLPVSTLKEIARERGILHLSSLRKAEIIEALLATDPKPDAAGAAPAPAKDEKVMKPEPPKAEPVKEEVPKAEPVKEEPPKAEPVKEEVPKTEPAKEEPPKREPPKPETRRPEPAPKAPLPAAKEGSGVKTQPSSGTNRPAQKEGTPAERAPRREGAPQGAAAGRTQVRRPQNAAGTGQSETGARRPMQQENTPNTRTVYPQKAANAPSGRQEISGAPRQSTSGPERRPAPRPETNRAPQPERTAQPDRSGRTQVRRPQQGQPQHYAAERTQIQTPRPQPVRQPAPPENTGYVAAQPDMPAYSSVNNDAERYPYPDNAAYPAYSEETDTVQERALQPRNRNGAPHPDSAELRASDEEKRISLETLDSGETAEGILEIMPDGFGFIRGENYLPGDNDVYVAPSQIRRFNMKTGDIVSGTKRIRTGSEKFAALLFVNAINGRPPEETATRPAFEDLTPIYPDSRLHLETPGGTIAMRIVDLLCPIGKGQRGMIVSPPKAGKTTILKQVAQSMKINHPSMYLIVLLIDERPEEVTDIKESLAGPNVEVIYSTFDELPEHHKRVSEMVLERAKRLVEQGHDVMILLDSITRLARAYNLTVSPSGRTLTGGLDPAALHMPKRFFGAARNTREGGSLTILATALVDTGSRMDDVVYEEFKGTGNMELVLDRKLSERRIFPAVDILKSGTRRDELLLTQEELDAAMIVHRATNGMKGEEAVERILDMFARTRTNRDFIAIVRKTRFN